MKKILLPFFLCIVYQAQAQDKFIRLPNTDDTERVTNIGVFHKPSITIGKETAYTDSTLINNYFQTLAEKIDTKKVVLVVEYPIKSYGQFFITEDSTQSMWITQKMRSLGFRKWIATDTRIVRDSAAYFNSRTYLFSFIEKYIQVIEYATKDTLGFTNFSFSEKMSVPEKVLDTAMRAFALVFQDMIFEENMKTLCLKLKSMGFVPIIISGSAHTLALGEPCMIQIDGLGLERIKEDVLFIKARQFLLKYFIQKIKDKKTGPSSGRFFKIYLFTQTHKFYIERYIKQGCFKAFITVIPWCTVHAVNKCMKRHSHT